MRTAPVVAALLIIGMTSAAATGQPITRAIGEPFTGWSAAAGFESLSLRDISRNMRPPDASPIAWRGEGPAISARYERAHRKSSHTGTVTVTRAGSFDYVSPTRTVAAAAADTASRVDIRYEYRRYFWRDAGVRGLDIAGGIQGLGTRFAFERHITSSAQTSTRIAGGGVAGVVAVNFERWDRFHARAAWANGGVVSRRRSEHSADALSAATFGGGGWITDLAVGGDWRLNAAVRMTATWQRSASGYSSTHFSYSERHQSIVVGAVYAR